MHCPLYALHGAHDDLIPPFPVDRLHEALERRLHVTCDIPEDGDHGCRDLCHIVRPRVADWRAERLGAHP